MPELNSEMAQMDESKPESSPTHALTKVALNNFMVAKRPMARQAKDHTIKKLVRHTRKLRDKKNADENKKKKLERKADKLGQEILFMKKLQLDEIMKFALLQKRPLAQVIKTPKAKIEERALCRLAEHKSINAAVTSFRQEHTNWAEEVPNMIKALGIRHRQKKLQKLEKQGRLESYIEKEQNTLKLLQELTDIEISPDMLKTPTSPHKKQTSKDRKRKREQSMNNETTNGVKKGKLAESEGNQEEDSDSDNDDDEVEEEEKKEEGAVSPSLKEGKKINGVEKNVKEMNGDKKGSLEEGKKINGVGKNAKKMNVVKKGSSEESKKINGVEKNVKEMNGDQKGSSKEGKKKGKKEKIKNSSEGKIKVINGVEKKGKKEKIMNGAEKKGEKNVKDIVNGSKKEINGTSNGLERTCDKDLNGKLNEKISKSNGIESNDDSDTDASLDLTGMNFSARKTAKKDSDSSDSDDDGQKSAIKATNAKRKKLAKNSPVKKNKKESVPINKVQGISLVKQLNLNESNATVDVPKKNLEESDEEEDFFANKKEGKEDVKKEKKKSSFFVGGDDDDDDDEDDDDDGEDEDDGDSSKYFKRNQFRDKEEGGMRRGGRGDWGRGRGRGRGDRGRGWGDRGGRGGWGRRGDEDGGENTGTGRGRGRGSWFGRDEKGEGNRGWGRGRGDRRGRGGWGREENGDTEQNGGRGRGRDWGRGGDSRGRGGRFGRGGNSGSDEWVIGGRGGRGRGRGGRDFNRGRRSFGSDANNIPLGVPCPQGTTEKSPGSLLHPSWLAKKKEQQQTASINNFKGKRMVFND